MVKSEISKKFNVKLTFVQVIFGKTLNAADNDSSSALSVYEDMIDHKKETNNRACFSCSHHSLQFKNMVFHIFTFIIWGRVF